jgi:hypothetical protein
MQTKAKVTYHFTNTRVVIMKKMDDSKSQINWNSHIARGNFKWLSCFEKQFSNSSKS